MDKKVIVKLSSFFLPGLLIILGSCAPATTVRRQQATSVGVTEKVKSEITGPRRRVGVIDFENKTAYGQRRLGNSASDILVTELVKSDKFVVIEREKMAKLIEEQKLGMSGAIDSNTAARLGRILGLNAIVTGAVSQFGVKTGGSDYLLTQSKRQTAECTVDVRVIDVETGQILYADSGKGSAASKTGSFLGMGTTGGYDETLEGESLRAAIVQLVDNIISQVNKKPWSCRVADVDKNSVYLNAGQRSGLKLGADLVVFHLGREITDPSTGLAIGNVEDEIATIEVKRYFGEDGSVAEIKSGSSPSKNDICRTK